ncbi:histidine triad protein member [Culex quinquefasciatus]|uniref:m7GpppX diphosphatase n=1 Tax=Culex quinquefasciatus TaxID=7176 RepID=B0WGJ2_CULQU|nr:histidine triad protein member [Culex quinquefasciatus]|eukprot:XP_001847826.1 histidine triad protein member [Culex quinquefasciatus]
MLEGVIEGKKQEEVSTKIDNKSNDDESSQGQQQPAETVVAVAAAAPTSASQSDSGRPSVDNGEGTKACQFQLSQFELVRILSNNSTHKSVALLGHFGDLSREQQAIVTLEKTAFTEGQLQTTTTTGESERNSFFTSKSQLRTEFINDVYGNFQCLTDPEINQLKVTIIYPASEKHIVKFAAQQKFLLEETAADYQTVTLPHLEQEQLSLEWLYNVLEHRKEQDRIVFEDPADDGTGFILLPDLKWDGKTLEQLYLLALVHPRGIKSLRDLTAAHLPLLRNVRDRGTEAIRERYGIGADRLRVYLHYQPTFYHFHVHFTFLQHDPPGIQCEKSHLLGTVISNLELLPDYYQRATLSCVLKETDKLYGKLKAAKEKESAEEPESKRVKLE